MSMRDTCLMPSHTNLKSTIFYEKSCTSVLEISQADDHCGINEPLKALGVLQSGLGAGMVIDNGRAHYKEHTTRPPPTPDAAIRKQRDMHHTDGREVYQGG